MNVQLNVMPGSHRFLELISNLRKVIIILSPPLGILLEFQDFTDIRHDRQAGAILIKKAKEPSRRLNHELARTAFAITIDLVIECENDSDHDSILFDKSIDDAGGSLAIPKWRNPASRSFRSQNGLQVGR